MRKYVVVAFEVEVDSYDEACVNVDSFLDVAWERLRSERLDLKIAEGCICPSADDGESIRVLTARL